ncbi:MAG: ABC transporter ATP-binding protein [Lachnospiraceae bacterium]|nr:ABC transporter ATP-binding protein [Lachnospiraceae bacterium]
MIVVKDLVKKYGDKTAIDGISFSIKSGEIVGLLGLNGAGKSTTMNCLTGYIAPTSGSIIIDGNDLLKDPDKAKKVIGYLPEVFSFYPDMRVVEYLDFICDLKGYTKNKQARKEHIEEICRQVGIYELRGRMIRNLSKGYKQRVGFAQALIGHPKVLILDEPTVGLDPSQIIEIRQLIRDSGKESTVIVSSHILSEIQTICDRVIVIHDGHIAADGSPKHLEEALGNANEVNIRVRGAHADIDRVIRATGAVRRYSRLQPQEDGCEDYIIVGKDGVDVREKLFRGFAQAGIPLLQIYGKEASLENIFLRLTGKNEKAGDK